MDPLLRIRLCLRHLTAAVHALQFWGDHLHEEARREPDKQKSDKIREEADDAFTARKSLWEQMQGQQVSSIINGAERGNVNVNNNKFTLPRDARELFVAVVISASILTNCWLWSKLHDAEKDIQTQVWLRDDALTKFQQGPFADLKAHVIANELNCKR